MRGSKMSGFTLVELMIVVVILGILAALAVPEFSKYAKRARTSEAMTNISRIFAAQVTYNEEAHERGLHGNFVSAPPTPMAAPGSAKYPSNSAVWMNSLEWRSLGFALDSGHYYQYSSPASSSSFAARAQGNLDNDGMQSTFTRAGVMQNGELVAGNVVMEHELE